MRHVNVDVKMLLVIARRYVKCMLNACNEETKRQSMRVR